LITKQFVVILHCGKKLFEVLFGMVWCAFPFAPAIAACKRAANQIFECAADFDQFNHAILGSQIKHKSSKIRPF
jgi:hypothetical protein